MGFKILSALALMLALAGPAQAAEAAAIPMRDAAGAAGRPLGDAWAMPCPPQTRLVGVRLHEDGGAVVGVEALCARLSRHEGGFVWAEPPAIAKAPEMRSRKAARAAAAAPTPEARSEGNVLRARSDGVSRFNGSRAVLITVPRGDAPAARRESAGRVFLKTGRKGREVVCPEGSYVQGVRTGTAAGRRGGVRAVQLICAQGNGRTETVGAWPQPEKAKRKKAKAAATLTPSRTMCGGGSVNPHDGKAGRALIGAVENGRIVSLGLICARAVTPGPVSEAAEFASLWLTGLTPQPDEGERRIHHSPRWYAGSDVAVCRDGSRRFECAQESADLFCMVMHGSGGASSFEVGAYAQDAIAAGGKRCPAGKCRAFQSITCLS